MCACVMYDINEFRPVGEGYEMPASHCDDLTGFHFNEWATHIVPKGRELKRFLERRCRYRN